MPHSRLRLIDLNYYVHRNITEPEMVWNLHAPSQGYAHFLQEDVTVEFVKHAAYKGSIEKNNIRYTFFKGRNKFWHIPLATHQYIKKTKPQVVLVHGFVFPLQVIVLRLKLGAGVKIFLQHHGEKPFVGLKGLVQKMAGRFVTAWLFTGTENAREWLEKKVIATPQKCVDILSASTSFSALDKNDCQKQLNISGNYNFIWVGHLNSNKDPLTVITAFEKLAVAQPAARLYLVYQTGQLLPQIQQLVDSSPALKNTVQFTGTLPHDVLQQWFSACDYYVSGSHREACGFALLEAMACGCIPIVTAIPSFKKITGNGTVGLLYEAGNREALAALLLQLDPAQREKMAQEVQIHFDNNLSFKKIAADLLQLFRALPLK